jgi:ribokinase
MPKNPFQKKGKSSGFDVVTVGAATRDVFIQSKKFKNVKDPLAADGLDVCFPLGAKIDLDSVIFETGGGATNAAVTFSRFGLRTACAARVGNDPGGNEIIARLKSENIDTSAIQTDQKKGTGYSLILVSSSGQRAILVSRGASSGLDAKGFDWKKIKPEWIYLTSVGGNIKTLKSVFDSARKLRIRIAWNPGNAEIELGMKKLLPFLIQTDIINFNREEAAALAEIPPRDLDKIFHHLGILPRQALIVTDGARGAYVHSRGVTWFAPAIPGKRVNTTGAGDAFGSAFTAAAITTGNLETALRAGMLNSFGVITHMGAKAGILKRFPSVSEMRRVKIKKL